MDKRRSDLFAGTTGSFDLLAGRSGESDRLNGQLHAEITITQDLQGCLGLVTRPSLTRVSMLTVLPALSSDSFATLITV